MVVQRASSAGRLQHRTVEHLPTVSKNACNLLLFKHATKLLWATGGSPPRRLIWRTVMAGLLHWWCSELFGTVGEARRHQHEGRLATRKGAAMRLLSTAACLLGRPTCATSRHHGSPPVAAPFQPGMQLRLMQLSLYCSMQTGVQAGQPADRCTRRRPASQPASQPAAARRRPPAGVARVEGC